MLVLLGTFSCIKKWLAESARAWASYIRWKSASSGSAEPSHARQKAEARTGGEKGRHLWARLVQRIAEGKTPYELGWKVKGMMKNKRKKVPGMNAKPSLCLVRPYIFVRSGVIRGISLVLGGSVSVSLHRPRVKTKYE